MGVTTSYYTDSDSIEPEGPYLLTVLLKLRYQEHQLPLEYQSTGTMNFQS